MLLQVGVSTPTTRCSSSQLLLACIAAYLTMIKNLAIAKQLDSTTLLFYNTMVSIMVLAAASWGTGEVFRAAQYQIPGTWLFMLTAVAAVCLGLTISHSTYVCTRVNEPLTTSVAGNFKNVVMTGVGMLAFGDYQFEWRNTLGILISMGGAVWYAYH